jgi:hypothetical protein
MALASRRLPLLVAPGRLQRALVVSLGACAVMAWVVLLGFYTLGQRIWMGLADRVLLQPLEAHWQQIEVARRLQGLVWVVTAILFLAWVHRVYGSLVALGLTRLRFSPRWAVGVFLVPLVNLVWPFLVVRDMWNASERDVRPGASSLRTSPWIAAWWGLFVAASLVDPGPWRLVQDPRSLAIGGSTVLLLVGQLVEIAAAVVAIVVVRTIGRRHDDVRRALAEG